MPHRAINNGKDDHPDNAEHIEHQQHDGGNPHVLPQGHLLPQRVFHGRLAGGRDARDSVTIVQQEHAGNQVEEPRHDDFHRAGDRAEDRFQPGTFVLHLAQGM